MTTTTVPSCVSGEESIENIRPFREIKSFTRPIEGKLFVVSSDDKVVHVHQSRDAGQTWQLALVVSLEEYHRGLSAFWIDNPNCQDSESFLEMVRFIQSGYVLPNRFPIRNFWDPAEQWTEIQCTGAVFGIARERVR